MTSRANEPVLFRAAELLPPVWQPLATKGPVRTFNPAILRAGEGWLFAYRVVAADGLRRIGICRLDDQLRVRPDTPVPLTDSVRFQPRAEIPEIARTWFADPRLYRFGERLFVYWNSGWHEPRNCQFLQELDPQTLLPMGNARELLLVGERRKLEKNWTFFMHGGEGYAVYSIAPHRVLRFSIDGSGDIPCTETAITEWSAEDYPSGHGGLRGGTPPVLADGKYWSFCHSVHDGTDGYRYAAAAYAFAAEFPFRPTDQPITPLNLAAERAGHREYPRLNPAVGDVIYPCGAVREGSTWWISHGINDEVCAISRIDHAAVLATLRPVHAASR